MSVELEEIRVGVEIDPQDLVDDEIGRSGEQIDPSFAHALADLKAFKGTLIYDVVFLQSMFSEVWNFLARFYRYRSGAPIYGGYIFQFSDGSCFGGERPFALAAAWENAFRHFVNTSVVDVRLDDLHYRLIRKASIVQIEHVGITHTTSERQFNVLVSKAIREKAKFFESLAKFIPENVAPNDVPEVLGALFGVKSY